MTIIERASAIASARVIVLGHGALARHVEEALSLLRGAMVTTRAASTVADDLREFDAAVLLEDGAGDQIVPVARNALEAGVVLVHARIAGSRARIGPLLINGGDGLADGCPACAACHEIDRRLLENNRAASRSDAAIHTVVNLVVLEVCKALEVARGDRPGDAKTAIVDFDRWRVETVRVARHPSCAVCDPRPVVPDDPRGEALHWWAGPGSGLSLQHLAARVRPSASGTHGLFEPPRHGGPGERNAVWRFFRERGVTPSNAPLANGRSCVVVRREAGGSGTHAMVSEGFDFSSAETAEGLALMEAAERLSTLSSIAPRGIVDAAFRDVAGEAVDPRLFPLYTEEQYRRPELGLRPFDADVPVSWVWGIELGRRDVPVLVPADLVYATSGRPRIFHSNSNGAACHADPRRATVNALYEVVERDALMVAWLNRLSLPRIEFAADAPDPWSIRRTLRQLDLDVTHVDLTTDLAIPVTLAVVRDRRNPAFFLVNMVASLDARVRLTKLYRELSQFLTPYFVDRHHFVNERSSDPDPDHVKTFSDHVAFYQSPERNRLAAFLTSSERTHTYDASDRQQAPLSAEEELSAVVSRLAAAGLRVITVPCTPPPLRALGLHAVRVLVTGLQPLNAAHVARPLRSDRLSTLGMRLGLADRPCGPGELNPWPHPFW